MQPSEACWLLLLIGGAIIPITLAPRTPAQTPSLSMLELEEASDGMEGGDRPALTLAAVTTRMRDGRGLSNCSLRIDKPSLVVVTGEARWAPSQIAPVITGACPLVSGEVRLFGRCFRQSGYGVGVGRALLSDTLFYGSLARNIATASATLELSLIRSAAEAVGLADAIARLPRGYETLVTEDLPLDYAEKQLVLLARAVYTAKRGIILEDFPVLSDENLAGPFMCWLKAFNGLRIVATTSPKIIELADQVCVLRAGDLSRL